MPYRFILLTWLLVIPLNMIAISLAVAFTTLMETGNLSLTDVIIDYKTVVMIGLFSIPFSMPGLFGLLILVWIAKEFLYDPQSQFLFISVGCGFTTVFCYLLLEFILHLRLEVYEYMPLVTASLFAVGCVLFITRRHFYSFYEKVS